MANGSIVDFLNSQGKASDYNSRAALAAAHGITGYQGTALQNTQLLAALSNPTSTAAKSVTVPVAPVLPPSQTTAPGVKTTPQQRADAFTTTTTKTTPTTTPGPITSSQLKSAAALPDATTYAASQPQSSLSSKVSAVASTTLSATGNAIDALRAQQQADKEAQIAIQEKKVANDRAGIASLQNSTAEQDALTKINDQFKVDQTISQLSDINNKIVQAQEALNMGLVYEGDRGVRMDLLSGRSASLQKQGLAVIGALQGTAQVLQGNITLAQSYAQTVLGAIKDDNTTSLNAYTTLLNLDNQGLVTLKSDEKDIVNARITALDDQNKQLQQDGEDVMDLMVKYPTAFLKGGVTLLDTKQTAIQKMLPTMSTMEMQTFNADLAVKLKNASTKSDADGSSSDKQALLALKSPQYTVQAGDEDVKIAKARGISVAALHAQNPNINWNNLQPGQSLTLPGMTEQEAVSAFGDSVAPAWIHSIYGDGAAKAVDPADQLKNANASQYLDENGNLKPGVTFDSKGNPSLPSTGSGFWGGLWKAITGS